MLTGATQQFDVDEKIFQLHGFAIHAQRLEFVSSATRAEAQFSSQNIHIERDLKWVGVL